MAPPSAPGEITLAKRLLEVIPPLMHEIRSEVRAVARESLTVPQFRILAHLQRGIRHVGHLAEYQGVSQPAMSKMVNGLVSRGLIRRASHDADRRHIELQLTEQGSALFQKVHSQTQVRIAD